MTDLRIATVQAGLNTPSTTSRLADSLQGALVAEAEIVGPRAHVTRINLRDLAVKVTEATLSGVKSEQVDAALSAVTKADVLIAVTPTFNASFSGVFKSFFDLVEPRALEGTVTILGATGGTARHSLVVDTALRPLFTYMRAMAVPTSVFASADDFASSDSIARRSTVVAREALALLGSRNGLSGADGGTNATATDTRARSLALNEAGLTDSGLNAASVLDSNTGRFVPFSDIAKGFGRTH